MKNDTKLKICSLFTGCGGMDLGAVGGFEFQGRKFSRLPTEIVFSNDIDSDATNAYNANLKLFHHKHEAVLGDVREIKTSDIPDFDILLAGFPCQPFSNAGNRKGVNDDNGRGTLFEVCERVLKDKIDSGHKPKAFIFENVRGILSSKMPDGTTVPEEIKRRMDKLDYEVSQQLLCASDYGVPQKRYRVLIIGIDKKLNKDSIKKFDFSKLDELIEKKKRLNEEEIYSLIKSYLYLKKNNKELYQENLNLKEETKKYKNIISSNYQLFEEIKKQKKKIY